MTYRYSVLNFLNFSLKIFFPTEKRQFLWKYLNHEIVIVSCFNAFAHAQSTYFPIEGRRYCTLYVHQFAKLNDICPSYSGAKLLKIAQKWNGHWTCRNDPSPFLCVSTGKQRSDRRRLFHKFFPIPLIIITRVISGMGKNLWNKRLWFGPTGALLFLCAMYCINLLN